ncbi:MAG: redoxin family protein [Ruminiclostridium sp.]|nr:redoxin family protein [Ruminiclostridium sp.]
MDKTKTKEKPKNMRPSKRRLIQVYAALLYNAHIRGFIQGNIYTGKTKIACVPGFNCYSCPGAVGSCPLGALQNALAYSGKTAPFYVFGILILYGIILGRTICGFLCPLGLIQELLHKIPTPKIPKNSITRALSYLKYIILAVFVCGITLWYGLAHDTTIPGFCKYICPAGTFEGAAALLANPANAEDFGMLGILFTRKFVIMLLTALFCIFCYRAFCRFICPLGAIYSLFSKFSIIGVKVDRNRCSGCGACVRNCGMDVRKVGDRECINCGKCMEVCAQKAISIKAGSFTLKAPEGGCADDRPGAEKKRKLFEKVTWYIAFASLVFALVWFNFLDPSLQKNEEQPVEQIQAAESADIPIGYEVGSKLPDFETELFDGGTFSISASAGKPVFINLWATYCGPCVRELPLFEELYREHKDDIAMVAVHYSELDDDPAEFAEKKGLDLPFAIDTEDQAVWNAVGGTASMPQTIVLDRNGIVIYNKRGSVKKELLESLYEEAAA